MASKQETLEDVLLVVADVDGALVTPDKVLTSRARAAVQRIIGAGIESEREDGGRRLRPYGPRARLRGVTPRIVPMNHSNKDGTLSA